MNESLKNQEIANRICHDLQWDGQRFRFGDRVILLDGADPDAARGMVMEVTPPMVDIIRCMLWRFPPHGHAI